MKFYWLKYRKDTEYINPRVSDTSNGKLMILWKCAIDGSKKSRFINKQELKRLLRNLGLKTQLSKVLILGDILFWSASWMKLHWVKLCCMYKMNEIVNKFLLAGDKFMSEMFLKQPAFTYCACGPFTKNKKTQKFKEKGDTNYIYKKEYDQACF